jgi:MFS family permease
MGNPDASVTSSRATRGIHLPSVIPLLGSLWGIFILSQFYRSAIAVIAPDLTRELELSPEALGVLTGAFFLASAAMQIPLGVLLDRFGPRRIVPSLLVASVVGAVLFASAESATGLTSGQFLIGLGCSGVFMGGFVVFSRWFAAEHFATVTSVSIAISTFGLLLSGTPLAAVVNQVGWRTAFLATGAVTAMLALGVFFVVRDAPAGHPFYSRTAETFGAALRGVGEVMTDRELHRILPLAFTSYASVITVRGLWGGPYLAHVHGLGPIERGNVLLVMSTATLIGMLAFGPLDRLLDTRKLPILVGGSSAVSALLALALLPSPPLWLATLLFCALGGFIAYFGLMLAHGRALFPDRLVGRAITVINFSAFVGVGFAQVSTGFLIGWFPAEVDGTQPEAAFRLVFGFLAVMLAASLGIYTRARDVRPSEGRREPHE